jgi:hypothetical protein
MILGSSVRRHPPMTRGYSIVPIAQRGSSMPRTATPTATRHLNGTHTPHVLYRLLLHLVFTGTPRLRRPAQPTARVSRALQLPLDPDRLRQLHDMVWIAETRHIPGP